jgi:hypothetical protein
MHSFTILSTTSRPVLGPTQPPIQWVPGVRRPVREADHSLQSRAGAMNVRATPPLPNMSS